MSESTPKLAAALVRAQAKLKNPAFDSTNPHFRSKFASLAAVRAAVVPVLAEHGIAVVQNLVTNEAGVGCETILMHESGESLRLGPLYLPAAKHDPQGFGSCATYCRRYSLMAVAGVVGDEDDDANAGTDAHKAQPPKLPSHVEAIRGYLAHDAADKAAQILAGLVSDEKRAVWAQLSAAEQARLRVFSPKQKQTETEVVQ